MKPTHPQFGDVRFFVVYRPEIVLDDLGDMDPDATESKSVERCFSTKSAAEKFAAKILPKDKFDCVALETRQFEQYEPGYVGGYWEEIAVAYLSHDGWSE